MEIIEDENDPNNAAVYVTEYGEYEEEELSREVRMPRNVPSCGDSECYQACNQI